MDAYLSAASLQFNRQLFSLNNPNSLTDLSLNSLSAGLPKLSTSIDLFNSFTTVEESTQKRCLNNKGTDINKFEPLPMLKSSLFKVSPQISQEGSSQPDTELDSYTKMEEKVAPKVPGKRGKRKIDKTNIKEFVADERRRLYRKMENCRGEKVVFNRRVKNSKKDPKISAENYRGSRYWGVSKNKSKWQVSI